MPGGGGRRQVLCLPPLPLYCPQVQCHLILAVLKYIERIVPKMLGLALTQTWVLPPAFRMAVEEKKLKL